MNRRSLFALTAALGLAGGVPAAYAQHAQPSASIAAAPLTHEKIAALVQEIAPGTDIEALGDQIRAVVRDNAPAGADIGKLQNQVFEMFHEAMAQVDTDPAAKDHLKMMVGMITAAQTDPAAREHVKMMLAMHADGR